MITDQPLVSVLMTAYNREKYIAEAIDSVLASTYTNWELIVVDDGSSDNTVSIARSYANLDSRVHVIQNEKNLGDYPNRNKAAGYAKGKYIKYVDSDDMIYSASLSVFVEAMEKFPQAAVGIMSKDEKEKKMTPVQLQPVEAYRCHFFQKGILDTGPSGLIFRTDRFREIGGFSGKRYIGDTEINLRLAAGWPVVRIEPGLVFWRQHEGQEIVAGSGSTGYLELELPMIREELNKKECPLSSEEKAPILKYYRTLSARQILKLALANQKPALAVSLYKKLSLNGSDLINAVFRSGLHLTSPPLSDSSAGALK